SAFRNPRFPSSFSTKMSGAVEGSALATETNGRNNASAARTTSFRYVPRSLLAILRVYLGVILFITVLGKLTRDTPFSTEMLGFFLHGACSFPRSGRSGVGSGRLSGEALAEVSALVRQNCRGPLLIAVRGYRYRIRISCVS